MAVILNTATYSGIDGHIVSVEVDITRGLPGFYIVGIADMPVRESKERVRSAIINSGYEFPVSRITINLAPADIRKNGSQFDLPIAIGILMATNQIKITNINEYLFAGELSLNGELKKIKGALPLVIEGCRNKIIKYVVPLDNSEECTVIKEAKIYAFSNLNEVITSFNSGKMISYNKSLKYNLNINSSNLDFADVIGHESCKRALEIAAAGNHNIIMAGPPGSGKTMLAERVPSILPSMNFNEALEVTKIYSVSGKLNNNQGIISERPFRNPHHTSTKVTLFGGGINLQPGEISLAHNGVLFLDEIVEFKKEVLEVMRQPLENRKITISRIKGTIEYPANIMLIGALNPCPCGFYGSDRECICSEYERKKYIGRISGPILDRIDIFMFVRAISFKDIRKNTNSENSDSIKKRVLHAREIQAKRFSNVGITTNAQMNAAMIKEYCKLDTDCIDIMESIYNRFHLSTRAYSKILKVARTIADLNENSMITKNDIIESVQYRKFLQECII